MMDHKHELQGRRERDYQICSNLATEMANIN